MARPGSARPDTAPRRMIWPGDTRQGFYLAAPRLSRQDWTVRGSTAQGNTRFHGPAAPGVAGRGTARYGAARQGRARFHPRSARRDTTAPGFAWYGEARRNATGQGFTAAHGRTGPRRTRLSATPQGKVLRAAALGGARLDAALLDAAAQDKVCCWAQQRAAGLGLVRLDRAAHCTATQGFTSASRAHRSTLRRHNRNATPLEALCDCSRTCCAICAVDYHMTN